MAKKLKLHIRKLEVISNRGAMLRHRKKIRKEESCLTGNADSSRQKNYTQSNSCGFTLIIINSKNNYNQQQKSGTSPKGTLPKFEACFPLYIVTIFTPEQLDDKYKNPVKSKIFILYTSGSMNPPPIPPLSARLYTGH